MKQLKIEDLPTFKKEKEPAFTSEAERRRYERFHTPSEAKQAEQQTAYEDLFGSKPAQATCPECKLVLPWHSETCIRNPRPRPTKKEVGLFDILNTIRIIEQDEEKVKTSSEREVGSVDMGCSDDKQRTCPDDDACCQVVKKSLTNLRDPTTVPSRSNMRMIVVKIRTGDPELGEPDQRIGISFEHPVEKKVIPYKMGTETVTRRSTICRLWSIPADWDPSSAKAGHKLSLITYAQVKTHFRDQFSKEVGRVKALTLALHLKWPGFEESEAACKVRRDKGESTVGVGLATAQLEANKAVRTRIWEVYRGRGKN